MIKSIILDKIFLSFIDLLFLQLNLRIKGETQGTFRRSRPLGNIVLIGLSLIPSRQARRLMETYTLSGSLAECGCCCLPSASFFYMGNGFVLFYVFPHRFLISGHLKIANSLRSSSTSRTGLPAIFLTVTLIRNHCTIIERNGNEV